MSDVFMFYDVLEPSGNGSATICVSARVHLLSTNDGGKTRPVSTRYRPNHNFGDSSNRTFYIGQFEVPEDRLIQPGETAEIVIAFLNVVGVADLLQVGRKWRIQEGGMLVGEAEVLSVLS
jgi:translation elongation factor EF-Tu-like GTPase